jgi:hypothetical protein
VGLFCSVVMVVALMRKNVTREVVGAILRVSQATVTRGWDPLRRVIGPVLACFLPNPTAIIGTGTVLVEGTVARSCDCQAIPDLFFGKTGYPGTNLQIAGDLDVQVVAAAPIAIHGARHDAHAYAASGLADPLSGIHTVGNLGYADVHGTDIVPIKRLPSADLDDTEALFDTALSDVRAGVEHAVSHVKTLRMLNGEGACCRCPIEKYQEMLTAITGRRHVR